MPVNEFIKPTSGTIIIPGGLRLLTLGEIALAKTLYGNSIEYFRVWVHRESYLPFNLQPINVAMSPDGEMWFREDDYSYSLDKVDLLHYGLEQQASIVSDYWLLLHHGLAGNSDLYEYRDYNPNESVYSLIGKYKSVLNGFPG